jgi:hypothetical protein
MHAQALKAIMGKLAPNPQRNFKRAMRGFVDYFVARIDEGRPPGSDRAGQGAEVQGLPCLDRRRDRAKHKPGTKARLALEVILQTGHARSDVVRTGDQRVRNGRLTMARQKTGTAFSIPLLPELVAELVLHRRDGAVSSMVWLTTERDTPFGSAASFGNWFADRCRGAGVPGRAHGLRKASAIRHALHCATPHELMAWHGWKTINEAQRYCEQAEMMKLADNAAAKLISGTKIVSAADPLRQIAEKRE